MKMSVYILVFGLQISTLWAEPQKWTDWVMEGRRAVEAGNYRVGAEDFRKAFAASDSSEISARQWVAITTFLAAAYGELGLYADSEFVWRQALAKIEKTEGPDSLDYALLLGNILVLPTQTRINEGDIDTLRRAIIAHRGSASPRDLAMVRSCLGNALIRQHQYSEAEILLLDSQTDFDRLRTTEPQLLATLLDQLGTIRYQQSRFAEAIQFHRDSLNVLETALGAEHPALIVTLNELATSMFQAGGAEEAATVYKRAVLTCTKTLGADHPECGVLLENYSSVLKKLGRKRDAREMLAQAQQILSASDRRNGIGAAVPVSALQVNRK